MNRRKKQIQAMNRISAKKHLWASTCEVVIEISEEVLNFFKRLWSAELDKKKEEEKQ